ncbi:MAG: hypothetical protein KC420_09380 [Myxococcales bacterium]|nr:hypothetical protein [Myxococcales bacterium]MCB9706735.1 hypothetical protein [Myxococcales bacterium]
MVAGRLVSEAAKRAVMTVVRTYVRKLITELVVDAILDKFLAVSQQTLGDYIKELVGAQDRILDNLDRAFDDEMMGVAHINIIGPTIVRVSGYEGELLPHQLLELMEKTIAWGKREADRAWKLRVDDVPGGKFLNVLMSAGPGINSWCFWMNFAPYIRRVEDEQKQWVEEEQRERMREEGETGEHPQLEKPGAYLEGLRLPLKTKRLSGGDFRRAVVEEFPVDGGVHRAEFATLLLRLPSSEHFDDLHFRLGGDGISFKQISVKLDELEHTTGQVWPNEKLTEWGFDLSEGRSERGQLVRLDLQFWGELGEGEFLEIWPTTKVSLRDPETGEQREISVPLTGS